jgi:hypothetical protein
MRPSCFVTPPQSLPRHWFWAGAGAQFFEHLDPGLRRGDKR